ncbi:MAG: hypothetical protein MMC33_009740 [Icmadophila ericetorum]|nr:hypothetical protein [Icmadophila ericetorum]
MDYIDWRTVAEILVRRLITVSAAQRPDIEIKMEKGFAALKDELKEVVTQLKTIVPTLGKQTTTGKATYASVVGASTARRQEAEKKFDAKEARTRREIIIKVADEKEAMQLRGKGALAPVIETPAAQKRLVTGQQKDEEVKKARRGRPPNPSKLHKISHTPTPGTTIERMFTTAAEEEKGKKLAEVEQTPNEEVHKGPDTIMANHDWENDMPAEEMHKCSDLNTAQSC